MDAHGRFYRQWVLACAAGELIGIGTATMAGMGVNAWIGEPQSNTARLIVLATFGGVGAIEGGALAALQWNVLRRRLPRLRLTEWSVPTIIIATTGWIAGMSPSLWLAHANTPVPPAEPALMVVLMLAALTGAAAGLAFGAAQWFVLRRHAELAHRWIWIHAPAWALGMGAIFLGASLPNADSSRWTIASCGLAGGALGGVLLGAVSGIFAKQLTPWVDERRWSLRGQASIVTGANSALGQEIALGLARLGSAVVLLCRRASEADRVKRVILAAVPGADVSTVLCDLQEIASIRQAVSRLLAERPRVDVLVHNAGAIFPQRTITSDGVEATLSVDVVGPHLLTRLLLEQLRRHHGRVITLTGIYHRRGRVDVGDLAFENRPYDWLTANNQAQRGRFLFTFELARREPSIFAAAVHPGAVLTGAQARLPWLARIVVRTLARPGFVRAEVGAIPVIRLASHPDLRADSGRFFNRCQVAYDLPDQAPAEAFWRACEQLADVPDPVPLEATA